MSDHFERYWRRSKRFNGHHIKNKCRGGTDNRMNIIRLDVARHTAWHFLFGNLDFLQVAELLTRAYYAKKGVHNVTR